MSVIIKAELRESPADNSHEGDVSMFSSLCNILLLITPSRGFRLVPSTDSAFNQLVQLSSVTGSDAATPKQTYKEDCTSSNRQ